MKKITVSYFRKVYREFMEEKITMSRMVELLNEKANQDECNCKKPVYDLDMSGVQTCLKCKKEINLSI